MLLKSLAERQKGARMLSVPKAELCSARRGCRVQETEEILRGLVLSRMSSSFCFAVYGESLDPNRFLMILSFNPSHMVL